MRLSGRLCKRRKSRNIHNRDRDTINIINMAGLVSYASSDEEEDAPTQEESILQTPTSSIKSNGADNGDSKEEETNGHVPAPSESESKTIGPLPIPSEEVVGPAIGPELPPTMLPLPEGSNYEAEDETIPQSPYSANRSTMRELTLSAVPNLDIPPSPPGSPSASTNAKFAHFLELKKKGVHFNAKLASSAASKNPSLMKKLMDFAEINEKEQYASTLSKEIWDPNVFPEWAYREELVKSQKQVLKKKEEEKSSGKRTAIDFVSGTASGESSRLKGRISGNSTSERMMAGLESSRSSSTQVAGKKRKTRFES